MAHARKKPCCVCGKWFIPDGRIGKRQRACKKTACLKERKRRAQASWVDRNPDYFAARRIQARQSATRPPPPLKLSPPLSKLPWDIAQDEFGTQGADFLGIMGQLLLGAAQDKIRGYLHDSA
jgi:hypothetical protein